jgi:hypothetical protein
LKELGLYSLEMIVFCKMWKRQITKGLPHGIEMRIAFTVGTDISLLLVTVYCGELSKYQLPCYVYDF